MIKLDQQSHDLPGNLNALPCNKRPAIGFSRFGEPPDIDRLLQSATSKTRAHSMFRHDCLLYDVILAMPEHRLLPLRHSWRQEDDPGRAPL